MTTYHEAQAEAPPLYVDLGQIIAAGPIQRPAPTIFPRSDGIGLLYAGKVNLLYGKPGAGKTHVALAAVKSVLDAGGKAAYIDLDGNGEAEILGRLYEDQRAPREKVSSQEWFRYAEPDPNEVYPLFLPDLLHWHPNLVVWDSMTRLMAGVGRKSNIPDEVTAVASVFFGALQRSGIASLVLDHPTKAGEGDDGPAGAGAKTAVVTGTSLVLKAKSPFIRGAENRASVFLQKERGGGLGQYCHREGDGLARAADFVIRPDGTTALFPPDPKEATPNGARLEHVQKLVQHWADTDEHPQKWTWDAAQKIIGCSKQAAGRALKEFLENFDTYTHEFKKHTKPSSSQFPDTEPERELHPPEASPTGSNALF